MLYPHWSYFSLSQGVSSSVQSHQENTLLTIENQAPSLSEKETGKKREKGIIILYLYYNHDPYGAGLVSKTSFSVNS